MPHPSECQDLSGFKSELSFANKLTRLIWGIAWVFVFRLTPRTAFGWRAFVLRCFGASVGDRVKVYNSVEVFLPKNLSIGDNSVVGPGVNLYCVGSINVAANVVVSQNVHICTASHDYRMATFPLTVAAVVIEKGSWLCADSFIGPGIRIGVRSIVGARAAVFKDVPDGNIVGGNPAVFLKHRDMGGGAIAVSGCDAPHQERPLQ